MQIKCKARTILLGIAGFMAAFSVNAAPKGDTNDDGQLSLEEFVLFSGERDLKQRDKNKDNVMSVTEWIGKAKGGFRVDTVKRFNTDNDEIMSADELVSLYVWIFENRDKNKDGQLSGDEIPKNLR